MAIRGACTAHAVCARLIGAVKARAAAPRVVAAPEGSAAPVCDRGARRALGRTSSRRTTDAARETDLARRAAFGPAYRRSHRADAHRTARLRLAHLGAATTMVGALDLTGRALLGSRHAGAAERTGYQRPDDHTDCPPTGYRACERAGQVIKPPARRAQLCTHARNLSATHAVPLRSEPS